MSKRIHVCAVDIMLGDAVGNHCLEIGRIFSENGYEVFFYAKNSNTSSRAYEDLFKEILVDDFLYFSYSIFDKFLSELVKLKNKKICYFHGITPPDLLSQYEAESSELCKMGYDELCLLKSFDYVVCNSFLTSQILLDLICSNKIRVMPPITNNLIKKISAERPKFLYGSAFNITLLGRVSPSKGIEDAINIVNMLRLNKINAFLRIIGTNSNYKYNNEILRLSKNFGLGGHINFLGFIDESSKLKELSRSDVLLSMSYHEGYGVPVIEAGLNRIPVISRENVISDDVLGGFNNQFENLDHCCAMCCDIIEKKSYISKNVLGAANFAQQKLLQVSDHNTFYFYSRLFES